jgi:uncharacterized protein
MDSAWRRGSAPLASAFDRRSLAVKRLFPLVPETARTVPRRWRPPEGVVVFGGWARGEASANTDLDVAVILAGDVNRYGEKLALADLAYDAIVETGIHVEPWPVPTDGRRDGVSRYDLPTLTRPPFPR